MAPAIRGNSLYTIVDGPSWTKAEANSVRLGGHLVTINDADENKWIHDKYNLNPWWDRSGDLELFGGLYRDNLSGLWKWSSGESVSFTKWSNGEPSNGPGELYLSLGWSDHYSWNDTYLQPVPEQGRQASSFPYYSLDMYRGIAEIPITSSITFSTTPKEGAGVFTTSINLSAGNGSNLANGAEVFWKITGITSDDLSSGSLQGSGTISNGKLDIQHSLKQDSDTGEGFQVSVYSDSSYTQQIGTTASSGIQEGEPAANNNVVIRGGTSDIQPPALDKSVIIGRPFTDPASGLTKAKVVASGSDNISGINYLAGFINSPSGRVLLFSARDLISGNEFSGTLEGYIEFPKWSEVGEWTITHFAFYDKAGNHQGIWGAEVNNYIVQGSAEIDNGNPGAPTLTSVIYNIADITINEGSKGTLTITRSGDTSAAQAVSISTRDGIAKAGSDYRTLNTSVSFGAGASSATVEIQTLDDQLVEGSEIFQVIGGAITGGPSTLTSTWGKDTGTITISDNDAPQKQLSSDYLKFTAPQLPSRPGPPLDKFYDYVDRYPFTLKQAFIADYRAGKTSSQHLWGQQHWINAGSKQGRVLEIKTGNEDINDYAAYVENYGTTLLDIYRKDPNASVNGGPLSLFSWGKQHYLSVGQKAGRQIDGGADFGAIVIQNPSLYAKWQDARIVDPTLSAFTFGFRNQNTIKQTLGIKLGQDTQEKLTGQYVYGLGSNDVLTGTASDDILSGGFGDDLIANGMGGNDTVYGGPGRDVFRLNAGGRLNIRDYRAGSDFIQLGNGLSESDITLLFDGINNSTLFKKGAEVLASVYGTNPNTFNFAIQSDGVDNVYI